MKFIDLFCGIGGIRKGFENVFKKSTCVLSSEIDEFAKKTYEANYKEKPQGDIREIKEIEDFDILLAGFPCQAFSNAGLKLGFKDETRGTLFFEIKRILELKNPPVFLLENVKGLLSHDKGKTFSIIKKTLEDLGYKIFYKVLNSKDFGLPQNRDRIFIVGFKDHSIEFSFPEKTNKETKIKNILEKKIDEKYTISDKLWEGHQRRKEENKINGKGFGYRIFTEEEPYTSTITARYGKDGSEILLYQKDKNPRKLNPREALNLQGFPKDFKIVCSDSQTYKQAGNSVSVPVIEAIAKKIKEVWKEPEHLKITED